MKIGKIKKVHTNVPKPIIIHIPKPENPIPVPNWPTPKPVEVPNAR